MYNMEFSYTSPIRHDFIPVPESTIIFEFKLKGNKNRIKVNVGINIYYKNKYDIGRVSLIDSEIKSVYTDKNDNIHRLEFKIPQFQNCTQSYISIVMEPSGNIYEKLNIEDMKVEGPKMTYSDPQMCMHVPNAKPKVSYLPQNTMLQSTILPNAKQNEDTTIREWHDKIMFVSTWDTNCGIAIYTKDLLDSLEKICPGSFIVRRADSSNHLGAKLVHLQHEFGILPKPPIVGGKVIITWHSITRNISETMKIFESSLDVVAHIIPCNDAREYIQTSKDVFVVELGSKQMEQIKKEDAKERLGIGHIQRPIGFVFGFQSPNKNYNRLIDAAKNTGIHLIISGSTHFSGYKSGISNNENVTFLNRYLTDEDIDLFALASNILLFDYADQDHYSCSSALHRTVGAGRPVICANTRHFRDIHNIPKFGNQQELENCIAHALANQDSLGKYSLEYTNLTSRESIARRHMEIYGKYVSI